MLTTVLDRVTTLIGRAFVITAFFPLLLLVFVNIATISMIFGVGSITTRYALLKDLATPATVGFFLCLIAGAYALMILHPLLRGILEGTYPMGRVGTFFQKRNLAKFISLRENSDRLGREASDTKDFCDECKRMLIAANNAADKAGTEVVPEQQAASLSTALDSFRTVWKDGKPLARPEFKKTVYELVSLYGAKTDKKLVEAFHKRVITLLDDYTNGAEAAHSQALVDLQARFPVAQGVGAIATTSLGNVMAAMWSYPYSRYRIDATHMWPRLQKTISSEYLSVVEDASIAYNLSVTMVVLSFFYTYGWLLVALYHGASLLVPLGGAIVMMLFYAAAHQGARSYSTVLQTSFDMFRFQLLTGLHVALPVSIETERQKWESLNQVMVYGNNLEPLVYEDKPK